ncbi:PIN domain-containing protein [Sphingorhabdus arenilitoris]|uniref:PIN domain-containing protein n=1 Tax=Sphingorhabdus arenilitoris TaxID=1490041 RepID=A0ABV8REC6_9SPHN
MAVRFLDTNILLYAASEQASHADAGKHEAALQILSDGDFAISAQVLQEFYTNAIKLKPEPLPHEIALQWVELLGEFECVAIDHRLVTEGILLSHRYQTSYWDGAIIAAAHAAGAAELVSEDLNDGQIYGDVTVTNPFKNTEH